MKKLVLISLCAFALFTTCKKSQVANGNGCISVLVPKYVTGPDSVAATALFKANNMDYATLRYESVVLHDTLKNNGNTSVLSMVFAIKYFNGLPDLTWDYDYNFSNGIFQNVTPSVPAAVNTPPVAQLTLQNVRQAYINAAVANHLTRNVADSCLVAQFGYYNLNAGINNTTPNYVTAWLVTPAHVYYPAAIILDANGSAQYFSTGPVLF